ncbi:MAG: sigma-54 dependent transcriptional regulator [Planctomycetota bacterium]
MRGRILVVDDEPLKRITLQIELSEQGFEVFEAADAEVARQFIDTEPLDAVISDVRMPGTSGIDLLTYIKQKCPETGVILMTAYAAVDTAVLAIKRGAYDYITKPFTTRELLVKLEKLLAGTRPAEQHNETEILGRLVTVSPNMKRLFKQARAVADSDRAILLRGENGTGKGLFAEALHELSGRADKPFVHCSCTASSPSVLEGELFGHVKGAFTGALRRKAGRLELANQGTLLLEDVAEIPLELQAKLLRIVEQREFERIGGETPVHVDVWLICATRCDLPQLVQEERFREDLYSHLNAIMLNIPPLRERPNDIPVLCNYFLEKHIHLAGGRQVTITANAMDELMRYSWPGNVRELEHVMERALALCGGHEIRPAHVLPLGANSVEEATLGGLESLGEAKTGLSETLADIERRMILMALRQCEHNQVRTAQHLGIPRTTLRDKMAKYQIPGG